MRVRNRATAKHLESMLTVTEVSLLLNVHPNTLRRWSDNGIIKVYRIGLRGDRRFKQDDVNSFLAGHRVNIGIDNNSS